MKNQHDHSIHHEYLIGFMLLLLMVVGGSALWAWQTTKPNANLPNHSSQLDNSSVSQVPKSVVSPPQEQVTVHKPAVKLAPKSQPSAIQLQPQTYWLKVEGTKMILVPQLVTVQDKASKEVALKAALDNMLNSTQTNNLSTTIPAGTKLLGLQITPTGIYVNLSGEFASGGGTSSMVYRVAQVLYTASSLEPNAKVFISVDGKLLNENYPLGGEGITLKSPLTRKEFTEDFSIEE
ncbi:GerMN domain-containing protein [Nostoc linckia FACHB-104]|nr:GerMN domain-containing protein [Nostoc linckia FACHB-104]